jgi:hypothetical protein
MGWGSTPLSLGPYCLFPTVQKLKSVIWSSCEIGIICRFYRKNQVYSPDLAPCDFYLFGYIKYLLASREFADRVELQEAVMAILDGIGKVTLGEMFRTWIARLSRCIEINGECVESTITLSQQNFLIPAPSCDANWSVGHPGCDLNYVLNHLSWLVSIWRNIDFFHKQWDVTSKWSVPIHRPTINRPISRHQITSRSGDPQGTCWPGRREYDRCSTVIKVRWQWSLPTISPQPSEKTPTMIIHDVILDVLDMLSFSSIHELGKVTCSAIRTIWWYLMRSLGFIMNHCHWLPQTRKELRKLNMSLSQMRHWVSPAPSNINVRTSLSSLMSRGSILPESVSR